MSLLNKIKSLLGRPQAQPPASLVSDQSDEMPVSEPSVAPPNGSGRGEDGGLKDSIARGVAEGTAREAVRKLLEGLLGD